MDSHAALLMRLKYCELTKNLIQMLKKFTYFNYPYKYEADQYSCLVIDP